MSSLQVGSQRSTHRGPAPLLFGAILALVIVVAAAYFVAAMGGTRYSPPYTTGAPATYAPGAPATTAPTPAPRYP